MASGVPPAESCSPGELRVCAGRFAAGFCDVVDELLSRPGALFDPTLLGELGRLLATDGPAAADAYRRLCEAGEWPAMGSPTAPELVAS